MPVFVGHGSADPARVPDRSGGVWRSAPNGASIGLWIALIMYGGSIGATARIKHHHLHRSRASR